MSTTTDRKPTAHRPAKQEKPSLKLPPIPPTNGFVDPRQAEILDQQVVSMFATSYLLPLLPMTRSSNSLIRRSSITSLCRLSDDHLRAAVAALRSITGKSVLADVLSFSLSELYTTDQQREAALGFVNVCLHNYGQMQILAEGLLPQVKRLLSHCNSDLEGTCKEGASEEEECGVPGSNGAKERHAQSREDWRQLIDALSDVCW